MENRKLSSNELEQVCAGYEEIDEETQAIQLLEEIVQKANVDLFRKFPCFDVLAGEALEYWKGQCLMYYRTLSWGEKAIVDKYLALHPEYDFR